MQKLTNKDFLNKALNGIKRKVMIEMYTRYNVPVKTFQSAVSRGSFSKILSYNMEAITLMSALFWQNPSKFGTDGRRR